MRIVLPSSKRSRPTRSKFVAGHAPHPPGDQPVQRQDGWCSTTTAQAVVVQPARAADQPGRHGSDLRPALHAAAAPVVPASRSPPRDDQGLRDHHARLLRRLHVLLDHRAPGPDHPVALASSRSSTSSAGWAATRSSRARSRDIGGPTANMYQMRCTKPEVEAICKRLVVRPPQDLQAAGHRPRAARRADARKPRGPGHRQGAGRLAVSAWTWPSARPNTWSELAAPPRRRAPEGRARTHRPRRSSSE